MKAWFRAVSSRAPRLVLSLALALSFSSVASADWWEENFEVHGFLTSKLYVRAPGFDFGPDTKISQWRTELNLEPELRLINDRERDISVSFYGVFRPIYDAVYEIHPNTWGNRAEGGDFGSSPASLVFNGVDLANEIINGHSFPGSGACVEGEFCLANSDTGSLFIPAANFDIDGTTPALIIDDTVFLGRVTAPWLPIGSRQEKIGGNATLQTYTDYLNSPFRVAAAAATAPTNPTFGTTELAASLAAAGTTAGTVGFGLGGNVNTPLNLYAGAVGDRGSLDEQFPADINRNESELKFDCFDNAHPWCFVREAYLDIEWGDTFIRLGKQQVVWGKTDAFRLQDNIMPVDLGYHNVFPPLEERRIPQLALDVIHTIGDVGPLRDLSVEFVWVFDRFRPLQVGQCGEPYAFTAACEARADAGGHQLFNFSLAAVEEVEWNIRNTEPGLRFEFRLPKPSIAFSLSAFWAHQDLPVARFKNLYSVNNPNPAAMLFLQGLGLGPTIEALAGAAGTPWTTGFDPLAKLSNGAPAGTLATANTVLQTAWTNVFAAIPPAGGGCAGLSGSALTSCLNAFLAFALPWTASEAVVEYPRVLTLGGSADYQIPGSDTILRLEFAWDVDRGIQNTAKRDGVDESPVLLAAIGLDRPTYIRFLNPNRTAFLSFQTFWEHVWEYDDGNGLGDGMIVDENTLISTLFMQNYWRNDSLILTNFVAFDWQAQAWITGPSFRWIVNQNIFIDFGVNLFFNGKNDREHNIRDLCPDGSLTNNVAAACNIVNPSTWQAGQWQLLNKNARRTARAPWWNKQSFADQFMEDRDEVWIGFTYQW